MASVTNYKVKFCRACKAANAKPKPCDACSKCKVLAYRVYWRQPDGTKRSEVFTLADGGAKAANAKKAAVENEQRTGTYVDPHGARILFLDYADEWAESRQWKRKTAKMWPTRRKLLVRYVGERKTLGAIDKPFLDSVRNRMAADGFARSYVASVMSTIKGVLKMALGARKIAYDPTIDVDSTPVFRADAKTGHVTADKIPTPAEAWRILYAAPDRYRAAHALGLAGLRIGEVLGLRLDHIDFDAGTLTVDVQATELSGEGVILQTPKCEKVRTIEVSPEIMDVLRRHVASGYCGTWTEPQPPTEEGEEAPEPVRHEMLFVRNGKLLSTSVFYWHGYTPALKDAGFPERRFTFHGYRHLCASHMLAQGTGSAIVAGHLGHHLHTLERVYAHWLRNDRGVPAQVLHQLYAAPAEAAQQAADERTAAAHEADSGPDAPRMPHAA